VRKGGNVAAVELKALTKRYGETTAVADVSLRIEHGQLVCLLGPSGCGKTTTLRLIAGFIEPSAGEIVVGGKVLSSPQRTVPPEGRSMSMIFQSYALWPHMTVAENVAYGLKIRKLDKAVIDAKLKAILSTTRLEALAERYPGELSGGQQQRVSLARALVVEPETLLLDEPLSNLDANLREEMRFEIRRLHDQYRYTTVYVTHDQAEAMTTADVIAVMNHGKVEQLGPPEEIYGRPRSEFVARFIGGSNILRGAAIDDARVTVAGAPLRTTGRSLQAGQPVALSVRQHEIAIANEKPQSADNHLPAVVTRQVFLGSVRDYTVALDDKTELRVTAPPGRNIAPGQAVWLHLPAEQCRALAEE
jgi:iron(III) transport system ATP-binding protein